MSALETLLAGLFDYAGLYPPANLSLQSAANNYLQYGRGEYRLALGRFIINLDRLEELRSAAGDSLSSLSLSVIGSEDADWASLAAHVDAGFHIETVEVKCNDPHAIERLTKSLSHHVETYFEVPLNSSNQAALKAIHAAGARVKIRMGGVVREAIPVVRDVAAMLKTLADLRLPFKATAGLHHPLRSTQPLTYEPQCPSAVMHGFVNLTAAAGLLHFGGTVDEAEQLLADEDITAWHVTEDSLRWRDRTWTTDQLATVRRQFLVSIGSCSFEEPVHDLKSLGWL